VQLPKAVYENRPQRFDKRLAKVIEYIDNNDQCRSLILMHYFGDTKAPACGLCDVCLEKKRHSTELPQDMLQTVRQTITDLLKSNETREVTIDEIASKLQYQYDSIVKAIRFIADHGDHPTFTIKDGRIELKIEN
jgi:ATP-dependent DNA helicase RecQ